MHPSTVLGNSQTLYIPQQLADALGWRFEQSMGGQKLTLHGWAPHYFTTPQGMKSVAFVLRAIFYARADGDRKSCLRGSG